VGSRLDDGSPLYLKDQTRCKKERERPPAR
jgi:hypothetical protein